MKKEPQIDIGKLNAHELRKLFATGDIRRDMDKVPPEDVMRWTDLDYAVDGTPSHTLDVYYPKGSGEKLPVILNIHGGGWSYGTKGQYQYYCMFLAQQGFAVVSCNYRLAPENPYPAALEDICTVLQWIQDQKDRFPFAVDKLFLTGDSAGAQLASQICAMVSNPDYAVLFPFPVPRVKVLAAALNCGVYDMHDKMYNADGTPTSRGADYMPAIMPPAEQLDVFAAMTKDYPPVIVMGSVNDPISLQGLPPLREALQARDLTFVESWYGHGDPKLHHVFHINISWEEAIRCNLEQVEFFKRYI